MISRIFLRGASRYRAIETTVKTATAHPAFWLVRSLLRGAFRPSLWVPIERPQLVPVPDCGASVACEPFPKWPKPLERESTLPSRFRVTDVFAPPRRQRASTTAGAASLATARGRSFANSAPRGLLSTNRKQSIQGLPRSFSHSLFRRVEPHETRSRSNTVPSLRFVVPSTKSARAIGASVCLPDTIRSRRFSRPQRFAPTRTLRLCFTPLPPLGFRSSELFSTPASRDTSRCPLLSCR